MLRVLLIVITIFIFAIPLGLPALLFCWLIGFISADTQAEVSLVYLRLLMAAILFLAGTRVKVSGTDNIPQKEPCLFVCNHRSYFDIFLQYQYIRRICGTVAKAEWKKIPLLRTWMKFIRCAFLDRKSLRSGVAVTKEVEAELNAGHAYCIYPEGTRGHINGLLPFHEGSFKSALVTGVPIVPVTFVHTDDIYENHRPFVRVTAVSVVFGEPIPTKGLDRAAQKALPAQIHKQMEETYFSLV